MSNASYLALQDGVVAGGGIALFNSIKSLPDTIGGEILKKALEYPLNQIEQNLGVTGRTLSFGDDIVDPALVIKNAVRNAISIASTVLTLNGAIILVKESNENIQQMPRM